MKLRRLLRWQLPRYDGRVWCGAISIGGLQPGEFICFTSYALAELVLPFSSFFTLLETYGLQLHHLLPHSITLAVIFAHLCEMYLDVRPSMCLFWLFHVLRSSRKMVAPISGYYFQYRTKGLDVYMKIHSPEKWDCWRDDWVNM
jgi:hypothetical protein